MKKEELKFENTRKDLSKFEISRTLTFESSKWLAGVIAAPILATVAFCYMKMTEIPFDIYKWLAIPFVIIFVYSLVHYIPEVCDEFRNRKKASHSNGERENYSVSVEKLSHIAEETVCYRSGGRQHRIKTIHVYYFYSGISWRAPTTHRHYDWSREYNLTPSGLYNTSVKDDEFYYITHKGASNSAYIYNTKFFELKEDATSKNTESL